MKRLKDDLVDGGLKGHYYKSSVSFNTAYTVIGITDLQLDGDAVSANLQVDAFNYHNGEPKDLPASTFNLINCLNDPRAPRSFKPRQKNPSKPKRA